MGFGDAFVVKLNPAGSGAYLRHLPGGSGMTMAYGIAVDGAGNAYVTGCTSSSDFPTTPGAFDRATMAADDVFVVKLNPAGSGLAYATFLGGSDGDGGDGHRRGRGGQCLRDGLDRLQ